MHPVLFKLGPLTIHTYGFALAVGACLGLLLLGRLSRLNGLDSEKVVNLALWVVIAGLIGSRLVFVLLELPVFLANPLRIFAIWEGGLVFYGGLAAGLPLGWFMAKKQGIKVGPLLDAAAPALVVGQFFGRLGCFFAGCCYGQPHEGVCSVVFTDQASLAPQGIPLHPTQLYHAGELLIIFAVLMLLWKRRSFTGQIMLTYGLLHGIGRLIIEQFRGDYRGELILNLLTPTAWFALFIAAASAVGLIILYRRSRQTE